MKKPHPIPFLPQDDSEMDSVTSVLNPELDKLAISVVAKEEFRKEIVGMIERSKAHRKKQMAELQKRAIPETAQIGAEAAEKGEKALVMRFDYGNDAKLMRDMGDNLSAKGKHCAMVFSADLDGETMACYAVVSDEAAAAGINATDWVNAALAPMGGKGGGKGPFHNQFNSLFSETYTDRCTKKCTHLYVCIINPFYPRHFKDLLLSVKRKHWRTLMRP
jgi:alanyl-tRNA synthetase